MGVSGYRIGFPFSDEVTRLERERKELSKRLEDVTRLRNRQMVGEYPVKPGNILEDEDGGRFLIVKVYVNDYGAIQLSGKEPNVTGGWKTRSRTLSGLRSRFDRGYAKIAGTVDQYQMPQTEVEPRGRRVDAEG